MEPTQRIYTTLLQLIIQTHFFYDKAIIKISSYRKILATISIFEKLPINTKNWTYESFKPHFQSNHIFNFLSKIDTS